MNNQVDICEHCLAKNEAVTSNAFSHKPSHTLLKTRNRRITKVERAKIIFQARDQTQRVKTALRPPEPKNRTGPGPQMVMGAIVQSDSTPNCPECSHCDDGIELPCWVCTECGTSIYRALREGLPLTDTFPQTRMFSFAKAVRSRGCTMCHIHSCEL